MQPRFRPPFHPWQDSQDYAARTFPHVHVVVIDIALFEENLPEDICNSRLLRRNPGPG
ncbi:hypothetical protein Mapa_016942 [Marchantia paleacea]|nr:hypothetical protein Mapa_016942 [Marchantia paleacea]